jgi:hypothetical protein
MWTWIFVDRSKGNDFFEQDESSEEYQAPPNELHWLLSDSCSHIRQNLALAFEAIDMLRPMHLAPAFVDEHHKGNYPDDQISDGNARKHLTRHKISDRARERAWLQAG